MTKMHITHHYINNGSTLLKTCVLKILNALRCVQEWLIPYNRKFILAEKHQWISCLLSKSTRIKVVAAFEIHPSFLLPQFCTVQYHMNNILHDTILMLSCSRLLTRTQPCIEQYEEYNDTVEQHHKYCTSQSYSKLQYSYSWREIA